MYLWNLIRNVRLLIRLYQDLPHEELLLRLSIMDHQVKLEITGTANDMQIEYLDKILSGLKYEDGNYNLVSLKDPAYQQ